MPINHEKRFAGREAYLKKMKLKFNVVEPDLNFNKSSTRDLEAPTFDPEFMTLDKYSGPWEDAQISHLIRRLKFGVTMDDMRHFRGLNMEQSVDLLLTEAPVPAPPVNDYNDGDDIFDPDVPFGETWVNAGPSENNEGDRVMSTKRWWIENIITQGHSITEKMLLFWHNHLVTEWFGVFYGVSAYNYMELLREHHMGNVKELIRAITIDISMLYYLNGASNHKDAPDENYARELQELFCIGKGPNAKFTEDDVRAAARVLTGWTVTWPERVRIYDQWRHDEDDKQFSEFYGNTIIKGRSANEGKDELDDLMDMIFETNEAALFLARKLYSFFVYPIITEDAENAIIVPLAEVLRDGNYEIKAALEKLFKSQHFYDVNVKGSIISDPVNFLLGTWKTLDPPVPYRDNLFQYAELKSAMIWNMHNKGMQLGDPPSVAGWPAYYQNPIYDKGWITTNTITSRAAATDSLVYWGLWSPSGQIPADLVAFADSLDDPGDPNKLIDDIALLFFGHDVTLEAKARFKSILLSGQDQDYYWSDAWYSFKSDPNDEIKRKAVEDRLKWMMQRVLQLAESQLM